MNLVRKTSRKLASRPSPMPKKEHTLNSPDGNSPDLCKPSFLHGTPNRLSTNTDLKCIPCDAQNLESQNVKDFQHNPYKMQPRHQLSKQAEKKVRSDILSNY